MTEGGEAFAVIGVVFLAIGLVATWVRNGRGQAKRDGVLEEKINSIDKRLEDENTGLGAIKNSVEEIKVNCASVTGSFKERFKNLEEDKK